MPKNSNPFIFPVVKMNGKDFTLRTLEDIDIWNKFFHQRILKQYSHAIVVNKICIGINLFSALLNAISWILKPENKSPIMQTIVIGICLVCVFFQYKMLIKNKLRYIKALLE
jgi:hypothetical protein